MYLCFYFGFSMHLFLDQNRSTIVELIVKKLEISADVIRPCMFIYIYIYLFIYISK